MNNTTGWLKLIGIAIGLLAAVATMYGCATSTAGYLDKAANHTDCSESVYYYRTAILHENLDDKSLKSDNVDRAVAGLKSTVPYCATKPAKVIQYALNAAMDLAPARPKDATDMALLAVTYAESHPRAKVENTNGVLKLAKDTNNGELWRRTMAIAIDRGTWLPGDVDLITTAYVEMPEEKKAFLSQLANLKEIVGAAAARGNAATNTRCSPDICFLSSGSAAPDSELYAYLRAYAAELARRGLGDTNRAVIVNALSEEVSRRQASADARRAQYAAQASAGSTSTSSMVSSMASVMGGIAAVTNAGKVSNAARVQAAASTLQTSSATGAPSACNGSYRANPSSFAACCRARGATWKGRVSLQGGGAEDQCVHTDGWVESCIVQDGGGYAACRNRGVR